MRKYLDALGHVSWNYTPNRFSVTWELSAILPGLEVNLLLPNNLKLLSSELMSGLESGQY